MDMFSWVGSLIGVRAPTPAKLPVVPYRGPAVAPVEAGDVRVAALSPAARLSSVAGPGGGLVANNSAGLTSGAPLAGGHSWWRSLMQTVARWIPLPVDPKP